MFVQAYVGVRKPSARRLFALTDAHAFLGAFPFTSRFFAGSVCIKLRDVISSGVRFRDDISDYLSLQPLFR